MGRRKIEIKAIKDDRNRSVTFLKRKGGLFKKAHELSVLCSVDVAVIIFGQNKKLYEFSSGQMQEMLMKYHYYQGPHEHKGPADFGDRGGGDDDDDDDEQAVSPTQGERYSPGPPDVALSNQPGMQHMRQSNPSSSPPVQNGIYGGHRISTPQPQGLSRPSSRNHRRASSNLVPTHHHQGQAPQAHPVPLNYGPYHQNQGYYQPGPGAPPQAQMQMHPPQGTPPPQQHQYPQQVPPRNQMRQMYLEEQRRQSMPANYPVPPQERPQSVPNAQHSPPQLSRPFQSPPLPGSPKLAAPVASRSHSIYTPVDDSRSMLAQHWETGPRHSEPQPKAEPEGKEGPFPNRADLNSRSQSIDVGSALRDNRMNGDSTKPSFVPPPPLQRPRSPTGTSISSAPNSGTFPPPAPSRVNSMASDTKRPRLTVQIPSEQSDAEANTGVSPSNSASPKATTTVSASGGSNTTPAKQATAANPGTSGPSSAHSRSAGSVVLPPPSPSATSAGASGVLSAGASGPKNPFARPLPPPTNSGQLHAPSLNTNVGGHFKDSMAETGTPMSALPSRFMSDGLLPSPSSFYPDWGFGSGSGGNNLASPAPYQPTPVKETGGGWKDEDRERERERLGKRKNSDEEEDEVRVEKKLKGEAK